MVNGTIMNAVTPGNGSGEAIMDQPTPTPVHVESSTSINDSVVSEADHFDGTMHKIFLQTTAAQAIAGFFTFAALFLTCYQVNNYSS